MAQALENSVYENQEVSNLVHAYVQSYKSLTDEDQEALQLAAEQFTPMYDTEDQYVSEFLCG